MAPNIKLDGIQKVTYKAPSTYKPPSKVTYQASNYLVKQQQQQKAEADRLAAQAAAYKKQQEEAARAAEAARLQAQANQARTQMNQNKPQYPEVGWQQNQGSWTQQTNQGNYQSPVNSPVLSQQQSKQSQQATANRYTGAAQMYFNQNQSPTKPYDPVKNQAGYKDASLTGAKYLQDKYGMDWRQNPRFSSILMNQDEWLKRRNAYNYNLSSYMKYLDAAAKASKAGQSLDIYGNWYQNNPNPIHNFWVTGSEWEKRNAAAPPGYMWTPFGSSFAKLNTAPTQAPAPAPDYGGGYADWGGYGGGGYGGGGSGGSSRLPEWWVEMVNWRI